MKKLFNLTMMIFIFVALLSCGKRPPDYYDYTVILSEDTSSKFENTKDTLQFRLETEGPYYYSVGESCTMTITSHNEYMDIQAVRLSYKSYPTDNTLILNGKMPKTTIRKGIIIEKIGVWIEQPKGF